MSKRQFKAESRRLLDLMINSIYTHREIFLRELISNASDAIDKLCYRSLTDETVGLKREDFRITVTPDEKAGTLTVSDNGIGMTAEELEKNLGVIAASGTRHFREQLAASDDGGADTAGDVIGQFGVGFYSAFMVAKKVTVLTRAFGEDTAHRWVSEGADGYTVTEAQRDAAGTDVILQLKDDTDEEKTSDFLKTWRLENLIRKYSDYIRWPIVLDGKTVNSMIPLWQKSKTEADDAACAEFYKTEFGDAADPLTVIRVNAEGLVSYRALLFVPSHPPFDYFTTAYKPGLRLYASGVQVMDRCPALLPEYFRFVQGVVDSPDLSLNISREMLQHDRQLKVIANNIEKKVKSELLRLLKEDKDKYDTFFKAFGIQLKYGVLNDFGAKKDELAELLVFLSGKEQKLISLKQYTEAMPEGQKAVYYACGESETLLGSLPQAEKLRQKGYDVLYLMDEVDSFVMNMLEEYDGKPLKNVSAGDLDLEDAGTEEEAAKEADEENKDLLGFVTETLGDRVKKTVLSRKLVSAPVCLSTQGEITLEMEQYFERLSHTAGTGGPAVKAERVLELNPEHPAFRALREAYEKDRDKAADYARLLYGQALLLSGRMPEDPAAFCGLVSGLM